MPLFSRVRSARLLALRLVLILSLVCSARMENIVLLQQPCCLLSILYPHVRYYDYDLQLFHSSLVVIKDLLNTNIRHTRKCLCLKTFCTTQSSMTVELHAVHRRVCLMNQTANSAISYLQYFLSSVLHNISLKTFLNTPAG